MADLAEEPISVVIEDPDNSVRVDPLTGTIETDQPDGSVVVQLDAHRPGENSDTGFYDNLVDKIDKQRLGKIANDLYDAIKADDDSRQEYLQIRARGLDLLGLKLQEPRSGVGDSSSGVEGMSSVTNPLLLESLLKGWANAQAELLPASGPVKVKDDGDETSLDDELADALERDMNHYLTVTASEYYPDTSHMLLWGTYLGGSGIKKVYRCPMRRRPVSESVDVKDFIVSDTTKDLRSCGRITHQISMRPSVFKRMRMIGAYKGEAIQQPTPEPNAVDAAIAGIQGTNPTVERPEDQPYTLWETQCELDLEEFAPGDFKGKGIPLPYLVTLDKDSREILAVRRDWNEDDKDCQRKRMYVRYPYVPGPGFYGTGLLNILGNCSSAMTAAWREALDAGMFASFPGGIIAKRENRQNTSQMRPGPGEFYPVETGGADIRTVVMGMPYRDVTPGLIAMMEKIEGQAQRVGGAAEIPAGEGLQNVPVGTMLAQIEQATKIMAAAHKGMHQAQTEEIQLLTDLFRENPEDFWVHNHDQEAPKKFWDENKVITALDKCNLVPVSDPNVPSHIHRVAKALALSQISLHPVIGPRLDGDELTRRILRALREDPNGLQIPAPPQQAQPDPKAIQAYLDFQQKQSKSNIDANIAQMKLIQGAHDNQTKRDVATVDLTKELIIHAADQDKIAQQEHRNQIMEDRAHGMKVAQHNFAVQQADRQHGLDVATHALEARKAATDAALSVHQAMNPPQPGKNKTPKEK